MSSKSAQSQGRRTPLTLNPQAKSVPQQQQQQGKQAQVETRGKQAQPAQKLQEQKKEAANNAAAAASAAGPGPGPVEKTVSKQQQNANLKNGFNNGTESNKPQSANTNGNKAAANAEPKKENDTRSKPAKPAEEQQQQQVKNGGDAAAKAAFSNNSGTAAQRKQQQKQTTPTTTQAQPQPLPSQQPQQQQSQVQAESLKAGEEKVLADQPTVTVDTAENVNAHDKTPTPKKLENNQEQQKQQTPTGTPTKANTPKSGGKKRTVTSAIDVEEINASPKKAEEIKPVIEHPTATSTPGKPAKIVLEKSNPPRTPLESIARKTVISGRPSIRAADEWSPSKYGTYRATNTDLDVSGANTSLNVTVGSEPGNNTSWFSFRSRKRERTPTSIENVQDDVLSPTKRARFGGIFSIMASPFTALRTRFAKTSIKHECAEQVLEEDEEENNVSMGEEVSMIEIQEDTPATEKVNELTPVKEADQIAKQSEEKKKNKQIENNTNTNTDSPLDASADGAATERCNMM